MLQDFTEKIEFVRKISMGVPKTLEIDLSIAIKDQVYDISGNLFYFFSAPGESEYIGIKVNETREPVINYSVHSGLITPFYRLYITTPGAQAGTAVLIYGTEAPDLLQIIDNRSTTVAGVGGILDELRGDLTRETVGEEKTVGVSAVLVVPANAMRKACILQAKSTNTGNVFIFVDVGVSFTRWFAELQPGMSFAVDDYRGDIYAKSEVNGQKIGWGEW